MSYSINKEEIIQKNISLRWHKLFEYSLNRLKMAISLHIFKCPIDMFVTGQLPSEQDLTAVISYLNLFFRTPNICSTMTRDRMCALL